MGKVDGCTTEIIKASIVSGENSKVQIEPSGRKIDLTEELEAAAAKLKAAEDARSAARRLAKPRSAAGANDSSLKVPPNWESWPITPECFDALKIYQWVDDNVRYVATLTPSESFSYSADQRVTLISRSDGCAHVKFALEAGGITEGYVVSVLAGSTLHENAIVAEKQRARAAIVKSEADRRAAMVKAEAEERAAIAKLPIVDSGMVSVFVASDRKCSEQFVDALKMEGIEKRKRLADLVTYGCGFLVDPGMHVSRIREDRAFCEVRVANGKKLGSGWVPCAWVKP
jgi:hypothetical protein